jgi:hypothetical protein
VHAQLSTESATLRGQIEVLAKAATLGTSQAIADELGKHLPSFMGLGNIVERVQGGSAEEARKLAESKVNDLNAQLAEVERQKGLASNVLISQKALADEGKPLEADLAQRDAKIASLTADIEHVKAQMDNLVLSRTGQVTGEQASLIAERREGAEKVADANEKLAADKAKDIRERDSALKQIYRNRQESEKAAGTQTHDQIEHQSGQIEASGDKNAIAAMRKIEERFRGLTDQSNQALELAQLMAIHIDQTHANQAKTAGAIRELKAKVDRNSHT